VGSEAFAKAVDARMRNPLPDGVTRSDWLHHRERLGWWRRQLESARELYRNGEEQALRVLYDYWRILAQARPKSLRFHGPGYPNDSNTNRLVGALPA
jgi:hypothetical protein